ncbi:DUF1232 domain-containing protein [Vibrio sp. SG41-7]|uniref:YkvA family protein n=1 Tax=Vibrio sp. SG41-7 TaxID=2760973 RepID=UPI0016011009|nr:YkvA family protein [Vibrio sp. SG41-7]MBB1465481.1 DUF1232 domain-containing protein [Vibrio sp. SG41-7]
MQDTQHQRHFSDHSFWRKLKRYAKKAGRDVIETALTLYYCAKDSDTPRWAKTAILSALGYFVFPIDAIPDVLMGVGYSDDISVLMAALASVGAHVKQEHKEEAKQQVEVWLDR